MIYTQSNPHFILKKKENTNDNASIYLLELLNRNSYKHAYLQAGEWTLENLKLFHVK